MKLTEPITKIRIGVSEMTDEDGRRVKALADTYAFHVEWLDPFCRLNWRPGIRNANVYFDSHLMSDAFIKLLS